MPRRARISLAHIPLHIIQRGKNRDACFYSDQDYLLNNRGRSTINPRPYHFKLIGDVAQLIPVPTISN